MIQTEHELEVKFMISNLSALETRLQLLGAKLEQDRVHEVNLRFDTPSGELARSYQVLRLRQDRIARMTYKGPGETSDGVRVRREIEFTVSDFQAAQALLEALGYEVGVMYEKYRTSYAMENTHIVLDEMPYGHFLEIEGPDPGRIRATSNLLELEWERRVLDSYTYMFEKLRAIYQFTFRDLSFENFAKVEIDLSVLGIQHAD